MYFHNNLMLFIGFPIKITYFFYCNDDYNQIRKKHFYSQAIGSARPGRLRLEGGGPGKYSTQLTIDHHQLLLDTNT